MLFRTSKLPWLIVAWIGVFLLLGSLKGEEAVSPEEPWARHVVDGSSRGADGVRLGDVNGDGRPDIVTGWEEGGVTRVYIHPGEEESKKPWPAVTVGETPSVEDAVFCDLDGDGALDVITSCEGKTRCMFVHWAPQTEASYLDPGSWRTEPIPATQDKTAWMFALPMEIDGKHGVDIAVASKGKDALVGWLQSPPNPGALSDWRLHAVYNAGWIMSLIAADVDRDGDMDLLVSDRKGDSRGILWLEKRNEKSDSIEWTEHRLGASDREVMFLDWSDLDGDGQPEVLAAVRPDEIHCLRQGSELSSVWTTQAIQLAFPHGVGTAKGVRAGDLDGDGELDIVYSCEHAYPPKRGVVWLKRCTSGGEETWTVHDISGPEGIKFDRIELLDLDGDNDLDVLTCEESHLFKGLGVIWYENPFKP